MREILEKLDSLVIELEEKIAINIKLKDELRIKKVDQRCFRRYFVSKT